MPPRPPPQVTIVTRTRGRPALLARSVASACRQSFGEWKLVIVNDAGPVEDVEQVVRALDTETQARVEIRHLAESRGMEAASNEALRDLATPFVTFLDDDDSWDEAFLETAVGMLAAPGSPAGAVTQSLFIEEILDSGAPIERSRRVYNPQLVAVGFDQLAVENLFTNNAFVFTREAFERVGPFDEELRVYGDWDFSLRFLLHYEIAVARQPLARYHKRVGTRSASLSSFEQIPHASERFRALLVNKWLRGEGGRSPIVGQLLAQGPEVRAQRLLAERIDKYLNALHRLRHSRVLRWAERVALRHQ